MKEERKRREKLADLMQVSKEQSEARHVDGVGVLSIIPVEEWPEREVRYEREMRWERDERDVR